MNLFCGFILGCIGGVLPVYSEFYKLRYTSPKDFPAYTRSWFYWFMASSMVLAGGGVVCFYISLGQEINPILALNIGASAPLLIDMIGKMTEKGAKAN